MIMDFIRRLLGMCKHDWKIARKIHLNEFVDDEDDVLHSVVSPNEYDVLKCSKCNSNRFRRR